MRKLSELGGKKENKRRGIVAYAVGEKKNTIENNGNTK